MFVFLICLVALALKAEAGYGLYGDIGPGLYTGYQGVYASTYKNYKPYAFEYGVSDPHTGDHKSQWETKDEHGTVRGSYSLLEPDGTTRIVDYIADDHGFRAIVKKIGIHGATVESHGGAVAEPNLAVAPIIAAEPAISAPALHVEQPILLKQHVQEPLVVKQPAIYVEQGPAFHSYDGGYEDYQNLIPYQIPKAAGVIAPISLPKQEFSYAPKQEIGVLQQSYIAPKEQIYVQPEILAPKAEGWYPQSTYVAPEQKIPETVYQQPIIAQPQPISYNQPLSEGKSYQSVQSYPVEHQNIPVPAYEGNLPVSNYQYEQSFGEPQRIWNEPESQLGHVVSHQHGDSSQSYYGRTGNLEDDSQYSNYDHASLNQGEYIPGYQQSYREPIPYKW